MATKLSLGSQVNEKKLGCSIYEVNTNPTLEKFSICYVKVIDIEKITSEFSNTVMDTSWIMNLDEGARRTYRVTVEETAKCLVDIFKNKIMINNKISGEFGEIMVSMGSSRALEIILKHTSLPIAELWKPQKKQNEGFDFHTVCQKMFINFGEAKFSSSINPHSEASSQANKFFQEDKHFRDRVHLVNLVEKDAINNLDESLFGAVVAFSMNTKNPLLVFNNAIEVACSCPMFKEAKHIYMVGVSHEC